MKFELLKSLKNKKIASLQLFFSYYTRIAS